MDLLRGLVICCISGVVLCGVYSCGDTSTCSVDGDCPRGSFCGTDSACWQDCAGDTDCSSTQYCNTDNGKCLTKGGVKPPPGKKCVDTCKGCCSGETCYPGTSNTQCGTSGAQCLSCSAPDVCSKGTCGACTSHNQCGATEICEPVIGCGAAFGRKWQITVLSAKITSKNYTKNPQGDNWDPFASPPDPFVVIAIDGTGHSSKTASNTITPTWNYTVETTLNTTTKVQFIVRDEDNLGYADIASLEFKSGVPIDTLRKRNITWTATDTTFPIQEMKYAFDPK